MSISPHDADSDAEQGMLRPGEIVLNMLTGILENPPEVSTEDEIKAKALHATAQDAEDMQAAVDLMQLALEHDPLNVDIHLSFLDLTVLDEEDMIPVLKTLERIGRSKVGEEVFEVQTGQFWSLPVTRSYMNVLEEWAEELFFNERPQEAVEVWQRMLRLNPSDEQGMRHRLLMTLLELGRLHEADALFAQFRDAPLHTCFAWGQVLRQCVDEDWVSAELSLECARQQNRFMEAAILGNLDFPEELTAQPAPGSEEEAAFFGDEMFLAWQAYPSATDWLMQQTET